MHYARTGAVSPNQGAKVEKKMNLIGIDLGTTGCRSMVLSEDLKILGEAYVEYPLIFLGPDEIEQDANLWWTLTKKVIKESVQNSKTDPSDIKGISATTQGISFVPVDRDCNPLRNAITWLDNRAKVQKAQIIERISEQEVFNITSNKPGDGSNFAKLLWLKQNEPGLLEKTYKILTAHDFLVAKLCGEFVTDHTMAGGTLLYDVKEGVWSDRILKIIGISVEMLPAIKRGGEPAGKLKKDVAAELGLSCDTIVAIGGQDQKCAALGAGINKDVITISLGTAAAITRLCDRPILDETMGIPCYPYLMDKTWEFEGCVNTASSSLKWLKDTLFKEKSYKQLDQMVESCYSKESQVFFYPYLSGMGTPHAEKGVRGFFYGLSLSTQAEEIVKSVLEGIAYQIRTNVDKLESVTSPAKEIRIFGGGSKSDIWCRMIANITGKRVVKPCSPETGGIGAAILAGIGSGVYKNYDVPNKLIQCAGEYLPDPVAEKMHETVYAKYRAVEKTMSKL